jgi:rRNA-processing protein FCF1
MKKYLFDSDVLIVSKNKHYNPNFIMLFWDWLLEGHRQECFYSIDHVKNELKNSTDIKIGNITKKDFLTDFADNNPAYFLKTITSSLEYGELMRWAGTEWGKNFAAKDIALRNKARARFAHEAYADSWLIAYAKKYDYTIITNEESAPDAKRDIKLPDAAKAFNVQCITLHKVMQLHAHDNLKFRH